jgi:imidazolonepropionase-like amidohydrolase
MRTVLTSAVLAAAVLATTSPATGQVVAITNAEIHPVSGPVIPNGTLVMDGDRIVAVGANVEVPTGARVVEGAGRVVTPGFIDSNSQIGLGEVGGWAPGTLDFATEVEELGASFNPVRAVNPENSYIPIVRLRGVTATALIPFAGADQLFAGQASVISLDGESLDEMIRRESAGVVTAMGEVGSARSGGSRAANLQQLHDALWDARARMLGAADDVGDAAEDDDDPRLKGDRSGLSDRELDALVPVISGEVPLVVGAHRVSDLRLAVALQEEFGLRLVIDGGAEAWRIADELAAADVAVIVTAPRNLPTFDGLFASLENPGRLAAAGVEVVFLGGAEGWRPELSQMAGLAVANGMDHAAALRGVTLGAAEVWGVADQMGSLEPGKRADVVVWSGDPFELSTSAEHIFIGGREIPEDSRQERLFDRYRDLERFRRIGG